VELWRNPERERDRERQREEQWRAASPTLPACQSVCQSGTHVEFCNLLLLEGNSACLGCFLQLPGFVRRFIRTLLACISSVPCFWSKIRSSCFLLFIVVVTFCFCLLLWDIECIGLVCVTVSFCDLTSGDELYWQIVHPSRAEENSNRLWFLEYDDGRSPGKVVECTATTVRAIANHSGLRAVQSGMLKFHAVRNPLRLESLEVGYDYKLFWSLAGEQAERWWCPNWFQGSNFFLGFSCFLSWRIGT
jgi:hypothetical protein